MIILDTINKSLEVKLAGAITSSQLPFVISYIDVTTTTYNPIEADGTTNNTTAVTMAAAPAASTQRQIKYLSIQNQDTASATVIIQYNDNGTARQIVKITLSVNDTLFYTDGEGFKTVDSTGSIKTVGAAPVGQIMSKVDDTNVTLTLGGSPLVSLLAATSLTLGWTGTLADARIASATNWNTAYTNRITSLTTTGTGAATLVSNVLNIPTPPSATFTSLTVTGTSGASTLVAGVLNVPTYTLSGLGGQPLATNLTSLSGLTYASLSFVKMSASGTFSLDTNTYLTSVNGGTGAVVVTVTGTTNKIDVSGGTGLTPTITISPTYVGQSSITTLGTVTSGGLGTGAVIGGVTMTLGSDASYDMYYRNASGVLTRLANGTTGQVLTATTSSAPSWGAAGSGANTALSNLASVSINTSLLAQTGVDLGATATPFRDLYLFGSGTYATTYFKFTGTPTSTRTITIPDQAGTIVLLNQNNAYSGSVSAFTGLLRINSTQTVSLTYSTTNAGGGVTPHLFDATGTVTAGTLGIAIDLTNGVVFTHANGTKQIASGAINLINLTNTAGSEAGDLALLTQSGGTAMTQKMRISGLGSVVLGAEAALATNATDGFAYIPTCAGTPTGVPTAYTGKVALIYDTTNNKMYVYNGAWKGGTIPGAWS